MSYNNKQRYTDWNEFYEVYRPIQQFYGLRMNSHEGNNGCTLQIYMKGNKIIKCEGEDMEEVLFRAIRELDWWERRRKRALKS